MTEEKLKYLKTSLENIQYEQYNIYKMSESVSNDMQSVLKGMELCIRGLAGCVSHLVSVVNDLIEECDKENDTAGRSKAWKEKENDEGNQQT